MHYPESEANNIIPPKGDLDLKARIWKSKTSPKIKHFLCRILSSALGTGAELTRRDIPIDNTCKRCCQHVETANQLFFQCDYAVSTWQSSNLPITSHPSSDLLEDNIKCLIDVYESHNIPEIQHAPLWTLWQLGNQEMI